MPNHQVYLIHGARFEIRAHLATKSDKVRYVIVFLHGFLGNSTRTWDDFPRLFSESLDSAFQESDLYFLEYATTSRSVGNAAWDLLNFLRIIAPNPSAVVQGWPSSPTLAEVRPAESYQYEQLVLVGHSMGAVAIRKAMIDAARLSTAGPPEKSEDLIRNATVLLFAPAIGGVHLSGVKGLLGQAPVIKNLRNMWEGKIASVVEVSPGSPFLEALRTATDSFASQLGSAKSLRASIAWAERDTVIANYCGYTNDLDQVRIDAASHWSVCKPVSDSDAPFRFLRSRFVH